jgi:hypothetical protein
MKPLQRIRLMDILKKFGLTLAMLIMLAISVGMWAQAQQSYGSQLQRDLNMIRVDGTKLAQDNTTRIVVLELQMKQLTDMANQNAIDHKEIIAILNKIQQNKP